MRVPCVAASNATEVVQELKALNARTAIIDIEPFVLHWHADDSTLDAQLASALDALRSLPLLVVAFSTNSRRYPTSLPPVADALNVHYISMAAKPLRLGPYRDFPTPGAVIGDQLATDGLLAARLGYTFIHYRPRDLPTPIGPRLMRLAGTPFRPLFLHPS